MREPEPMTKLTLDSLQKIRGKRKKETENQLVDDCEIHIIIGLGTCGIAAGAQDAINVFLGETYTHKIPNVIVKKTGCMGLCYAEPTVEIKMKGMPNTLYGNVTATIAKKIVSTHLLGGKLVNDHVFDYPSRDLYKD